MNDSIRTDGMGQVLSGKFVTPLSQTKECAATNTNTLRSTIDEQLEFLNMPRRTSHEDSDICWLDGTNAIEMTIHHSFDHFNQGRFDTKAYLADIAPTPLHPSIGGEIPRTANSANINDSMSLPSQLESTTNSNSGNLFAGASQRHVEDILTTEEDASPLNRVKKTEFQEHHTNRSYKNQNYNNAQNESKFDEKPGDQKLPAVKRGTLHKPIGPLSINDALFVDLCHKQQYCCEDKQTSSENHYTLKVIASLRDILLNEPSAASLRDILLNEPSATITIGNLKESNHFSVNNRECLCNYPSDPPVDDALQKIPDLDLSDHVTMPQNFSDDEMKFSTRKQTESKKQKGPACAFPRLIFQMLSDLEHEDGGTSIASFLPHGRAFRIHNPYKFSKQIMPKYFRTGVFASFQRQLNLYGFHRIKGGPDKGAYCHDLFVKGKYHLCGKITRKKTCM